MAALGVLAVLIGAVVGFLNFRETQRQNLRSLELSRRGQVNERFSKAIDQLGQAGDDKLDVRLGAIYALEQVARDSPDELHGPVMETLTAFLRVHSTPHAGQTEDQTGQWRAFHAIATVMSRRDWRRDTQPLELIHVDLTGARLRGAHLEGASLFGINLTSADLDGAHLEGAKLTDADLEGATLRGAHLQKANLYRAHLERANLTGAQLERAVLLEAHLEEATLIDANLEGVYLEGVDVEGAHLHGAHLEGAYGVTDAQRAAALKTLPELPSHIEIKSPSPPGEEADISGEEGHPNDSPSSRQFLS